MMSYTLLLTFLLGSWLAPVATCISAAEGRAKITLDKASATDPGAKGIRDVCGFTGKTDVQCRNTFFRDHRGRSSVSMQATINCMSQIEASQQQVAALTTALNADPSDMAKYGHSSSGGTKWVNGKNGDYTRDPSPANIEVAADRGRKQGELAASVAWTTTYLAVTVGYGGIGQQIDLIGLSEFASGIGDMAVAALGTQAAYETVLGDMYEAHARQNPQYYVEEEEMTGICYRHERTCHDANGKEYFNNHYEAPDSSAPSVVKPGAEGAFGNPGSQELDTNPILESDDTSGVDPDGFWKEDNIMDIPDGTLTTIDPDHDPDAFLKSCVASEERTILRQIGSTRTVSDSRGPVTEEEKRASAESNLRRGMCDKAYFGEDYCARWKQEKWRVPLDPEMQRDMVAVRAMRFAMCPRPGGATMGMSCEKAKQELDKRYALNELGTMMTGALFSPWSGPPVKQFLPVNFGRKTAAAGGTHSSGSGAIFLPPVQVAVPPPPGFVRPSVTRLRETFTTVFRPVVTPRPGSPLTTRLTRLVMPFTTILIPVRRPE
ncbi:hypothetical protein B0T16DRAFT_406299 [Cercophora newfieldiana]|uniref:Uncharacterized protein n=1 Tax=Cercophora newfieldiana TaxID=92897 RepID=A0AA40CV31_9PEZI|nr:hypothetical protein B0T16DRAFT_406299 [Cercophora newfieldiana]